MDTSSLSPKNLNIHSESSFVCWASMFTTTFPHSQYMQAHDPSFILLDMFNKSNLASTCLAVVFTVFAKFAAFGFHYTLLCEGWYFM